MSRSRRVLTRGGDDDFESSGEKWGDSSFHTFGGAKYVVVDLTADAGSDDYAFSLQFGGGSSVAKITIWQNGFVSLGDVTQAQIDWVAAHTSSDDIFGFPGDVIAAGVQDLSSVEYTFGRIDYDEPYDLAESVPILRVTWRDANFNNLQVQLTPGDFAIVDARVADSAADPGQVGFGIDGYHFDGNLHQVADFFFNDGLGGSFTGDTGDDTIRATARADLLDGLAGNDILDGGKGADAMTGGIGDDTYVVDNSGDTVIEQAGAGYDTVSSAIDYTLSAEVEKLRLSGTGATRGTGNDLANSIVGNAAANVIDGKGGADNMSGGLGDDTYMVDTVGDKVFESAGGGYDIVNSSVTLTLRAEIEKLRLTGHAAISGIGNELDNSITGNDAHNVLDGKAGADNMSGGLGDDSYVVDNEGDKIFESAGGGYDTVSSSVSYTLRPEIEKLRLTDIADIDATGNALGNSLIGNDGRNLLDGKGGADSMSGGDGKDVYLVDNVGDKIFEAAGGGTDTVLSSVTLALRDNVERLTLTGAAALNGTGNGSSNVLLGNEAVNVLKGEAAGDTIDGRGGNDKLFGGAGNDILTGGAGTDRFFFDTALSASKNVDHIGDFSVPDDTIWLDRALFGGIAGDGTLAAGAFRADTAAHDSSDRILYDSATGDIFYDADGTGAKAALLFATLDPGTALTNADFNAYTG